QPLMVNPAVLTSLNLTQNQVNQLNQLNTQTMNQFRQQFTGLNKVPQDQMAAQVQQLQTAIDTAFFRSAGTILDQQQLARFRQLQLQERGVAAFNDALVQQQLNLTKDQLAKLQALAIPFNKELTDISQLASTNPQEALRRFEALQTKL